MKLIPVKQKFEDNTEFINNPLCKDSLQMSVDFFHKVGYSPPWIGYYAEKDGELVGSCAFKGPPVNGTVEIAYGTIESHQNKGIGNYMCKMLINLALAADASIRITARTLSEENFSTRILKKNNFILLGTINDPEDGDVWEWEYRVSK